ncbi:MAG: isopentenyl-diphosphate Delta-isomerase [Bacteroidales bacterium]|nr:isopentenyl-diphosphate Delta-isomerase [Bacteroidales bacterium]
MIILVDKNDKKTGQISKLEAHLKGLLHRAFSVFIFNSHGEILMQQRAFDKYHTPGLWTNTCCSHPKPDENTLSAANRRLSEEMGLKTELKYLFKFQYYAKFNNNLTENEIDHIFIGYSDELPKINKHEVNDYKYMKPSEIIIEIKTNPENYTIWFRLIFEKLINENEF